MTASYCFSAQKEFTRTDSRFPTRGKDFNLFWRSRDHVGKLNPESLNPEPEPGPGLSGSCANLKIPGTVTALTYLVEPSGIGGTGYGMSSSAA